MKTFQSQLSWKSFRRGKFWVVKFCIIALVIVVVFSCTNQDDFGEGGVIKNDQQITPRNPTTVGDRVYFSDFDDFVEYYSDLELIMDTYNGDYFDSIVNLTTSVQTLNDLVYTTAGYFPTIFDYNMRAIINPYNEFQVDDVLVTLINDTDWILSDVSNGTIKTTLRGLTKGVSLDIENIPAGAQWTTSDNFEKALGNFLCGCNVSIEAFNCEVIRIHGSCSGFFGSVGGGEIDIDINNNSFISDEEVGNNFEYFINIDQFNGQPGTIEVTVDPNCILALNDNAEYEYDPEDFEQCDEHEMATTAIFENSTERIRALVYYVKKDFSGLELTRSHNAEIWSESYLGNNWTPSRAEMTVGVEANQRSLGCSLLDSKDDDKHRTNRSHLTVRVNWLAARMFHCDGDLIGTYEKDKNDIHIENSLEVDFHCCNE